MPESFITNNPKTFIFKSFIFVMVFFTTFNLTNAVFCDFSKKYFATFAFLILFSLYLG